VTSATSGQETGNMYTVLAENLNKKVNIISK